VQSMCVFVFLILHGSLSLSPYFGFALTLQLIAIIRLTDFFRTEEKQSILFPIEHEW